MTNGIVFAGSPDVAVPYLDALVTAGMTIRAVITRADSPVGRHKTLTATPVALRAEELGIPVIKTNSLQSTEIPECDLGVIVAYGGLVPPRLLDIPQHGWVNVHFSLLPQYRGAAPLQRSLWDGSTQTGVSMFRLVEELDAGPIYEKIPLLFTEDETATEALHRFAITTTSALCALTQRILTGEAIAYEQVGAPSFAPKFERTDGHIDWTLDGESIVRRIRALTTEPGAFSWNGDQRILLTRSRSGNTVNGVPGHVVVVGKSVIVATGSGAGVELIEVHPAGKKPMPALDWVRGFRDEVVLS